MIYETFIGTIEVPEPFDIKNVTATFQPKDWFKKAASRISSHAPYDLKLVENAMSVAGHLYYAWTTKDRPVDFDWPSFRPGSDLYNMVYAGRLFIELELKTLTSPPNYLELVIGRGIRCKYLMLYFLEKCLISATMSKLSNDTGSDLRTRIERLPIEDRVFVALQQGPGATPIVCSNIMYTYRAMMGLDWKPWITRAPNVTEDIVCPAVFALENTSAVPGEAMNSCELSWLALHEADRDLYRAKEALLTEKRRNRIRAFIGDVDFPCGNDFGPVGTFLLSPSPATLGIDKRWYGQMYDMAWTHTDCPIRIRPTKKGYDSIITDLPLMTKVRRYMGGHYTTTIIPSQDEIMEWVIRRKIEQGNHTGIYPSDSDRIKKMKKVLEKNSYQ